MKKLDDINKKKLNKYLKKTKVLSVYLKHHNKNTGGLCPSSPTNK